MLVAFFVRWREWGVSQKPVDELFTAVLLLLNVLAWFMAKGDEEVQRILRRDVLPVFVSLLFLSKVVLPLTPPEARLHTLVTNTGASLILAAFLVQSFKVFIEASTVARQRSRGKIQ